MQRVHLINLVILTRTKTEMKEVMKRLEKAARRGDQIYNYDLWY